MRILVLSDCHGSHRTVEKALDAHTDIKKVFYLGDGVSTVEEIQRFYPDREFNIVSGNCDWHSSYPVYGETVIEGVRVIYTHGHRYNVKHGTERLYEAAQNAGASLALYGHTHEARVEYRDGIYLVNPGASNGAYNGSCYAVIDISKAGIMPSLMTADEN